LSIILICHEINHSFGDVFGNKEKKTLLWEKTAGCALNLPTQSNQLKILAETLPINVLFYFLSIRKIKYKILLEILALKAKKIYDFKLELSP
jgi:hypothetical protein